MVFMSDASMHAINCCYDPHKRTGRGAMYSKLNKCHNILNGNETAQRIVSLETSTKKNCNKVSFLNNYTVTLIL